VFYALIIFVCATAEPCEPPNAALMMVTRGMPLEECANNGSTIAAALAQGKYFIMRCRLEARQS